MALIHDLQAELLNEDKSVGFVLLKLKFLASKLGADVLDDWVQHEVEGYPVDIPIPNYREASVTYTGTFTDIVRQLKNVSIPTYLIKQHAGEQWTKYEIRSSLSLIDQQLKEKGNDQFGIDASNLPLLLQNKIFEGMDIIQINSRIDIGSLLNIQHTVRARALDFVLKLEKEIPAVASIEIGAEFSNVSDDEMNKVIHLTNQIIYGGMTNITTTGNNVALEVNITKGDVDSLIDSLVSKGIAKTDAKELAEIAKTQPVKLDDDGTDRWLQAKVRQGAVGAWNIGVDVAKQVITEALKGFLGL